MDRGRPKSGANASRSADSRECAGSTGPRLVALTGAWERAEAELLRATSELSGFGAVPPMADGYYAIGQIRLRRGDLAGAEEALRQAHGLGRSPQPALALTRLAQGKVRPALAALTSDLAEQEWDKAARTRLLPAFVEVAIAAGELGLAQSSCRRVRPAGIDLRLAGNDGQPSRRMGSTASRRR